MRIQKIALSTFMLCLTVGGVALTTTGCAGNRYQRSTGVYLDDKAVGAKVKTALFRDPVVSGFDVHVQTYQGDVQLTGFVDSPEQRQRAADVARTVEGVRLVTNNLELKPSSAAGTGTSGSTVEGSQTMTQPLPDSRSTDINNRNLTPMPGTPTYTPNTQYTPSSSSTAPASSQWTPSGSTLNNSSSTPGNAQNYSAPNTPNYATTPNASLSNPSVPNPNLPPKTVPAFKRNVEITTSNGRATIRGIVANDSEKQSIQEKIQSIPGIESVDNQVQVFLGR